MHIITRKRLNDFVAEHREMYTALERWYRLVKKGSFASFEDLRSVFPTVDKVGKLTVFDIGGNKVRVIAAIHYNRRKIYIREVLTHVEYDKDKWKK